MMQKQISEATYPAENPLANHSPALQSSFGKTTKREKKKEIGDIRNKSKIHLSLLGFKLKLGPRLGLKLPFVKGRSWGKTPSSSSGGSNQHLPWVEWGFSLVLCPRKGQAWSCCPAPSHHAAKPGGSKALQNRVVNTGSSWDEHVPLNPQA